MKNRDRLIPPRVRAYIDFSVDATPVATNRVLVKPSETADWTKDEFISNNALTVDLTPYTGLKRATVYCDSSTFFGGYCGVGITDDQENILYAEETIDDGAIYEIDLTQYPTAATLWIPRPDAQFELWKEDEVTDDITNWNDLNIRQQRDGFSGVFISIQQAVEVCRQAKKTIHDYVMQFGLSARMLFEVMRRGKKDFDYQLIHSMRLNTSSYEESRDILSMDGEARDFQTLVKSAGKTKYDIPVSEIVDPGGGQGWIDWQYQHNEATCGGYYAIPDADFEIIEQAPAYGANQTLSITLPNPAEMVLNGQQKYDIKSQELESVQWQSGYGQNLPDQYFFMTDPDRPSGSFKISFKFFIDVSMSGSNLSDIDMNLILLMERPGKILTEWMNETMVQDGVKVKDGFPIDFTLKFSNIEAGTKFRLMLVVDGNQGQDVTVTVKDFDHFNVVYIDQSQQVDSIPAVDQSTFVNYLFDRISRDGYEKYTAVIHADSDRLYAYDHFLVAGESIRGYDDANFHASLNDFIEYMQFLGYEYHVDETIKEVQFRKRAYFFNPDITAIDLSEDEVSELVIKADDTYAYSNIKIGYGKTDTEKKNGRYAICGMFDYATDYENLAKPDSTVEIKCPYKADPVEIEILSWTRYEKTTDKKNDNDIFMLAGNIIQDGSTFYVQENRSVLYVVTDEDLAQSIGFYNVPYIPYYIVGRNKDRLGIAARQMKFTGTDAYRDATLNGIRTDDIYGNIDLGDPTFKPFKYEFNAGTHQDLPNAAGRRGLVKFMWDGEQKSGYIFELRKNIVNEKSVDWILLVKN